MTDKSLKIVDAADMTAELDAVIRRNLCVCFPADEAVFSKTRAWHGCLADWSVLIERDDTVAAHIGVIDRHIRVGDVPLHIAGVQNVFVLPSYRGQGLIDQVLKATTAEAKARGYDFGLLFCLATMEKLYRRNGWETVVDTAVKFVDDDGHEKAWDPPDSAMIHTLNKSEFPAGTIHVQGQLW